MAARVGQEDLEAIIDGDPNARISQLPVEAIIDGAPSARVTQTPLEAIIDGAPPARVSQELLQAILDAHPGVHISQIVIEVIGLFIEVPMPPVYPTLPGLTYPVRWKQIFYNAATQTTVTGADIDIGLSATPLHDFELTYDFLRDNFGPNSQEHRLLRGFFGLMRGNLGRCVFKNVDDFQVRSQEVGTTDGSTRIYTLQRTYGVGEYAWTEPVGYVDQTMPFNVYLDGNLQDPSIYTVDTTVPVQQQIIFAGIPTMGQVITVDMDYFYYCKLAEDNLTFEKFMDKLWTLGKITLHSCRPGA